MNHAKDTNNRYRFSDHMQIVKDSVFARLKGRNEREGTEVIAPDGKTPFLDAFEETYEKTSYAEALAEGIVRSWLETDCVFYENDILVGIARPRRPIVEHFSWGLQYRQEMLNDPAYQNQRQDYIRRTEKMADWLFPLTSEHMDAEGRRLFGGAVYESLIGSLWTVGGYQGHTVPNYPKLLRLGIGGVLKEIENAAKAAQDTETLALYRALVVLLEGFSAYILNYAAAAEARSEAARDARQKARFDKIALNCRAIANDAPETLYEAAQLCWFYALWDWVDCVGRMDQYLLSYYQHTEDSGEAFARDDIIGALILKTLEFGVHNITLGGVQPENGEDATNELTFLILQIARALHQTHPRLSIRIHENSPPELMELAVRMWSEGMSDPTLVSDPVVIGGLVEYGVPLVDARDYSMLGCQEIEIPGKSNFGCEDGKFNLAKVFEYTINDGKCRVSGHQVGVKTGYLTDYDSIDALWEAYTRQLFALIPPFVQLCNLGVDIRNANLAKLVKMPLTDDCIARGRNPDAGGAIYNFGVIETAGSSAVADAFAAIDFLVFRENRLTMKQIQDAIDANYEGHEQTRQILVNKAPKFGNDDPLADEYAKRVLDSFWGEIRKYRSVRGDVFMGACSLLTDGIAYGENTWAMPDGRFAGESLGNTIGPRPGADKNGVTAMLNSIAKLPLKMGVGGASANVLLPQKLLSSESLRHDIARIMTAYMLNGGQMAQITTANLEDMQNAQLHPERHGDLIVRVGGFSIHFVELDTQTQNEIISRY